MANDEVEAQDFWDYVSGEPPGPDPIAIGIPEVEGAHKIPGGRIRLPTGTLEGYKAALSAAVDPPWLTPVVGAECSTTARWTTESWKELPVRFHRLERELDLKLHPYLAALAESKG